MFTLTKLNRMIFGPKVGDVYEWTRDRPNPFDEHTNNRVEILATKRGWVQYRMCNPRCSYTNCNKISNFKCGWEWVGRVDEDDDCEE